MFLLIDQPCALGTSVSSFFNAGSRNPCTKTLDPNQKFDCTRKAFDTGAPPCVADLESRGKVMQEKDNVLYCFFLCKISHIHPPNLLSVAGTTVMAGLKFDPD